MIAGIASVRSWVSRRALSGLLAPPPRCVAAPVLVSAGPGPAMTALKRHQKNLRSISREAATVLGTLHPGNIAIKQIKPHRIGNENIVRIDFECSGSPGLSFGRFFQLEQIGRCRDLWLRGNLLVVANKVAGRSRR